MCARLRASVVVYLSLLQYANEWQTGHDRKLLELHKKQSNSNKDIGACSIEEM